MKPLIVFTDQPTKTVEVFHDSGAIFQGVSGVDDQGRPGFLITPSAGLPEGNGTRMVLTPVDESFNPIEHRGRLWIKERNGVVLDRPFLEIDDFRYVKKGSF